MKEKHTPNILYPEDWIKQNAFKPLYRRFKRKGIERAVRTVMSHYARYYHERMLELILEEDQLLDVQLKEFELLCDDFFNSKHYKKGV